MHYVPVLMVVLIVAILAGVVIVATGRGGEMARFPNDYAPPELGALAATDVALFRPPSALWGYHMQATEEALGGIALVLSERDVRIASLERQLADLRARVPTSAAGKRPPVPGPPRSAASTRAPAAGESAGGARYADPAGADGAGARDAGRTQRTGLVDSGGRVPSTDGTSSTGNTGTTGTTDAMNNDASSALSTGGAGSGPAEIASAAAADTAWRAPGHATSAPAPAAVAPAAAATGTDTGPAGTTGPAGSTGSAGSTEPSGSTGSAGSTGPGSTGPGSNAHAGSAGPAEDGGTQGEDHAGRNVERDEPPTSGMSERGDWLPAMGEADEGPRGGFAAVPDAAPPDWPALPGPAALRYPLAGAKPEASYRYPHPHPHPHPQPGAQHEAFARSQSDEEETW